ISWRWATELLRRSDGYVRPVDWLLFDLDTDSSLRPAILQAVPAPCIQEHWLAGRANRPPLHEGLIQGRENRPPKPQLRRIAIWRRELRRIGRQIRGLPFKLRKALTPSCRRVVPFADSSSP